MKRLDAYFSRHSIHGLLVIGLCLWLSACGPGAESETPPVSEADAVRFLEQATWGPTESSIQEVQQRGFTEFIEEQTTIPFSGLGNYPFMEPDHAVGCPDSLPGPERETCWRENYSVFPLQIKFFQNAIRGRDQLRQRVAFAFSQIFVVSGNTISQPYAMAAYQTLLAQHAFGNFRDLLWAITLSPAMGRYLDMVNNSRPDPSRGVTPNENFARELLQLFSIGVFKLNPDGTTQKNAAGLAIPAYDQETIEGFAHVFTGWTYPVRPGASPQATNPPYFKGSMMAVPTNHDMGEKKLLNDVLLPPNQTPEKDLNDAINNIFQHPNIGPFICKQLIQHLVTSNPDLDYVSRVAAVFNNNGQGVRGDMKAVIKAILLDTEARGDIKTDPQFGKLREPVKYITGIMRLLGGYSDGIFLRARSAAMGQDVYKPASVFGFYPQNYPLHGTSIVSPASSIYTATTALNRMNFVYDLLFSKNGIPAESTISTATGTKINASPFVALAKTPDKLVEKFDVIMMHKSMSPQMRQIITGAVNAIPANDPITRVRTAVYLIATSPQYQVER